MMTTASRTKHVTNKSLDDRVEQDCRQLAAIFYYYISHQMKAQLIVVLLLIVLGLGSVIRMEEVHYSNNNNTCCCSFSDDSIPVSYYNRMFQRGSLPTYNPFGTNHSIPSNSYPKYVPYVTVDIKPCPLQPPCQGIIKGTKDVTLHLIPSEYGGYKFHCYRARPL